MARLAWLNRTWSFDYPVELYPSVLSRFRGAPARLEEAVAGLSQEVLVRRSDDTWSIQENVGHLLRLEELPASRLDDFLAGAERLSPWTGNETDDDARHNERDVGELLAAFRAARIGICDRLEVLTPADFARSAIHPRLEQPIRLVDMVLFQSDHDDHHLARIRELVLAAH